MSRIAHLPALLALAACAGREAPGSGPPSPPEPDRGARIVVEAEAPTERDPEDTSFARSVPSRWASGRACLVGFFGEGSCTYRVELPHDGPWSVWLRYAATGDGALRAALDGATLEPVEYRSTGALAGKHAWAWTRLFVGELGAGLHELRLHAAPLRPDCLVLSPDPEEPEWMRPRAPGPYDEATLAALARPLPAPTADGPARSVEQDLPAWFERARVVLHTRLSPRWRERPAFRTAARAFADLGAPAFVRHVRTAGEGAWWASAVGPVEPWALDEGGADGDIVSAMIARAHALDGRFVGYYRHLEDTALAELHPDWVCRDDLGRIVDQRNGAPRMCFNSPYADVVETRLVELTARGADAIYLDEAHAAPDGCWCAWCRDGFREATGLELPDAIDAEDPLWQKLVDFQNLTAERTILRWQRAVHASRPGTVLIVSTSSAPDFLSPQVTDRLPRLSDSPKTEFAKGSSHRLENLLRRQPELWQPPRDTRLALGWVWNRDAADGRPPHVWVNELVDEPSATFASAGLLAHGCIANLDHDENEIRPEGGAERFRPALALGRAVGDALAGARAERRILVHVPAGAGARRSGDETRIWREALAPLHGAWTTLVRARAAVGIVTDGQLADGSFRTSAAGTAPALVLPASDALDEAARRAVASFEDGGGVVVRLNARDWLAPDAVASSRAALLSQLAGPLAASPLSVRGGPERLHAVSFVDRGGDRVVALANDFGWVWADRRTLPGGAAVRLPPGIDVVPPDASGVRVELRTPLAPLEVRDVLTGVELPWTRAGELVRIEVPEFRALAVLRIRL